MTRIAAPIFDIATRPPTKKEEAILSDVERILAENTINTDVQVLTLALFRGLNYGARDDDARFIQSVDALANTLMQLRSGKLAEPDSVH